MRRCVALWGVVLWGAVLLVSAYGCAPDERAATPDQTGDTLRGDGATQLVQPPVVPPPGSPVLAAGAVHTCGLRTDGSVRCWGAGDPGNIHDGLQHDRQSVAPPGIYASVTVSYRRSCVLAGNGDVRCWGGGGRPPPAAKFVQIDGGAAHVCGITVAGEIHCWGRCGHGECDAPGGEFVQLSAGYQNSCGIRPGGALECWGVGTTDDACADAHHCGQSAPPAASFVAVSAGVRLTCGIGADAGARCWRDVRGAAVPSGVYSDVTVGYGHACFIEATTGVPICLLTGDALGDAQQPGRADPPAIEFESLSAGYYHTCGLNGFGDVMCWGRGTTDADCTWPATECGQAAVPDDFP